MYSLKNKLGKILEFIEDKNDVVFVDFPLHHNIGDLLILSGTIKFFKDNSINVRSHLSTYNTDITQINKNITNKTTIVCHGGGNFGDIYDAHQKLRENIVKSFPDNRVIILPQTAYFNKTENQEKSKNIFKTHNNVIMFARDEATYNIFSDFSNHTYLMPDMAHELYGTLPKTPKNKSILYFLRNDIEKSPTQLQLKKEIKDNDCFDWSDLLTKKDHVVPYGIHRLIKINKRIKSNSIDKLVFKIWETYAEYLVSKMSRKFSSYERVVTSRLHGHILSCLVDVPSSIIDNSYGKNTSYYELWTKDLKITSVWDE